MEGSTMGQVKFTEEDMLASHLGEMVDKCVAEHGDKPSVSCILPTGHFHTLSFADVGRLSDAVAAYLREDLGLKSGDVVAIQCPNTLAYPVLAFGIFKAGLVATNVNPLYTTDETNHQLKDSGAKVWFVIDVFGDRIKQSIDGTAVERVYTLSLVDLFPKLPQALLGFALKYVKKAVPPLNAPTAGTLANVVKTGLKHMARGVSVSKYRQGQGHQDIAIFQYTGGTTGRSKGAELTHGNVVGNISQANKRDDGIEREENESLLLVLPLYHVYALAVGMLNSMYTGMHVVLVPVPRPLANLKVVFEKFDITVMPGVNTLYLGLLQEDWFVKNPPTTLRYCFSGAAPLQPATAQRWEELTGAPIYEGYGLTEGTCVVSSMPLNRPPKRGTCGIPIPGTEIRIVDDEGNELPQGQPGELWIRGPQIMRGYLNNPDATSTTIVDGGWLMTGDVAVMDDEGYLSIVDRKKDMVIVSGFNVYPTDIEDVLTRFDRVAEAAVVGAPDGESGEKVVAYVVRRDENLTEAEVIAHCREHLTGYKVPKTICFIKELPKSPVGKVLRRDLRDMAHADAAKA
ncbi:long-chain-fatty-acid--CoA ligase [Kordiimonas aestuarii]|uniref:long-chain-fatty-acid--CoA ligase n=1 Tax=Kordiimonas aestuarii TaxID=1005925 RepID=UPI0021CF52C3|nr:long-chain fatty acid--CoA ligase [Kordiimonas aestuarii]